MKKLISVKIRRVKEVWPVTIVILIMDFKQVCENEHKNLFDNFETLHVLA